MNPPAPVTLEGWGVRLEPLTREHHDGLLAAASDGELWNLFYTSVPEPDQVHAYISGALAGQAAGHMLPWAIRELASGTVVGSTRYHDIVPAVDRVEIGYTWVARRWQRTQVNKACKLLLLAHAFHALNCAVVGWRTDGLNFASQRAIEALGAKRDGVLRHHQLRRDGSVRDTVIYSLLASEWPAARKLLELRLSRHEQD
jgi:N-acetyltransferase